MAFTACLCIRPLAVFLFSREYSLPFSAWRRRCVQTWWSPKLTPTSWRGNKQLMSLWVNVQKCCGYRFKMHSSSVRLCCCVALSYSLGWPVCRDWMSVICPGVAAGPQEQRHVLSQLAGFCVFQVAGCPAAPVGFSPSLSWQQQQVSNFSDMRQVQHRCSSLLPISRSENEIIKHKTRKALGVHRPLPSMSFPRILCWEKCNHLFLTLYRHFLNISFKSVH